MNRRGFLGLLGKTAAVGAVAGVVGLDLAELLTPSSKTIFLPPVGGWRRLSHGNVLLDEYLVSSELFEILERDLRFTDYPGIREYSDAFNSLPTPVGYTINVRRPPRYLVAA